MPDRKLGEKYYKSTTKVEKVGQSTTLFLRFPKSTTKYKSTTLWDPCNGGEIVIFRLTYFLNGPKETDSKTNNIFPRKIKIN